MATLPLLLGRDWETGERERVRERGGKGKSDEMKEIKMEMNCAVEILTTQVFPSQVALIASLRDTFLCRIDYSFSATADVMCLRNWKWLLFFFPTSCHWGDVFFFFFFLWIWSHLLVYIAWGITSHPLINPKQCWVSEPCTLSPEI